MAENKTPTATSIVNYMGLPSVQENIQNTLKDRAPQFVASVAALVNANPAIAKCEKKSILSACLTAAALDLPINQSLGLAYVVPYNVKVKTGEYDDKGKEIIRYEDQAQFQMGWKGFVQLAIRTKQYKIINVREVHEGELGEEDFLTGEITFNWRADRDKVPVIGYVAFFRLVSGFEKMLYMSNEELKKHGLKYSKAYKSKFGQWVDDFDAMARKTVLKLLISKFGLMTSDISRAWQADQAVVGETGPEYPDNQPVDPKEVGDQKERDRFIRHIQNSKTLDDLMECERELAHQDAEIKEMFENKKIELSSEPDVAGEQ